MEKQTIDEHLSPDKLDEPMARIRRAESFGSRRRIIIFASKPSEWARSVKGSNLIISSKRRS